MHNRHTETIVVQGSRAEADGVFTDRRMTLGNATRNVLYALVLTNSDIQDTIGTSVPQGAFQQRVPGADDGYARDVAQHHQAEQPAHDVLPERQQTPVDVLEQMYSAPSIESTYDPYQTESFATSQSIPEQLAQPALEMTPGVSPVPTSELEQMTGMDGYDQLQVESDVSQDYPGYNALAEQAAARVRLPAANDQQMANEARRLIDELHNGLGYEHIDQIAGGTDV
jgi:hypothetical protein